MKYELEFRMWWEGQEIWRTNRWMNDALESLFAERDELLASQDSQADAQDEVNELTAALADAEDDKQKAEEARDEAEQELEKTERDLAVAEEGLEQAHDDMRQLRHEMEVLRDEQLAAKEAKTRIEEELVGTLALLDSAKSAREQALQELQQLRHGGRELSARHEQLQRQLAETEIANLNATEALRAQLDTMAKAGQTVSLHDRWLRELVVWAVQGLAGAQGTAAEVREGLRRALE